MGTGDWNDGMNRVGARGNGESVWNGWFFITVLNAFAELAGQRGDATRVAWCRERAEDLRRGAGGQRLGRRLVSPSLLRRRHAPGIGPE
jgi:cellobiose phosphorylase